MDLEFRSLLEYIICIYITVLSNQIIILNYTYTSNLGSQTNLSPSVYFSIIFINTTFLFAYWKHISQMVASKILLL